jgi:hypothetical protein
MGLLQQWMDILDVSGNATHQAARVLTVRAKSSIASSYNEDLHTAQNIPHKSSPRGENGSPLPDTEPITVQVAEQVTSRRDDTASPYFSPVVCRYSSISFSYLAASLVARSS